MKKENKISSKIYFKSALALEQITKKVSEIFNCSFYVPDDEDFKHYQREQYILSSRISISQFKKQSISLFFYTITLSQTERVGSSIDNLPNKIKLDDYLHTLLRTNGITGILDNQYPNQPPIKEDDYELYVSYDLKNSKTLNELKPIIDKLLYCDLQETTKDSLPALNAQMLGTDFYIIQQGEESGLFSYHITAEYTGLKEREFKQIDITPFFHSLFKYNKLTE